MSKLPHLGNLDRFVNRCAALKGENITLSRSEAQNAVREYQALLTYLVELQDELLTLREQEATQVEIRAPDF